MAERLSVIIRYPSFEEAVGTFLAAARSASDENGCRMLVPDDRRLAGDILAAAIGDYLKRRLRAANARH